MRATLLAVIVTAGLGLAAVPASAAPISGTGLGAAANETSTVEHVQHWRWGSGGHWRWGSGGHWRWGSGGHWRWGSGGHWRWGSRGPWRRW